MYRRLRRRGKEPQLTHEELLEIINDIWEIESQSKLLPLYEKGNSGDTAEEFDYESDELHEDSKQ